MDDLIIIDEQVGDDTLRWLNGPPKTWSMWSYLLVHVHQPNRWRMKQQRVRERREARQ